MVNAGCTGRHWTLMTDLFKPAGTWSEIHTLIVGKIYTGWLSRTVKKEYCLPIESLGVMNKQKITNLICLNMDESIWRYGSHGNREVLQQDGPCPGFSHGWIERRWADGLPLCIYSDPCAKEKQRTPCVAQQIKQDTRQRKAKHSMFSDLYTKAKILSMVATSGWSCPEVFSRSSKACLHRGTATSYLPWEAYWMTRLCKVLRRAGIS